MRPQPGSGDVARERVQALPPALLAAEPLAADASANLCARLPKLLALWDAVREHNAAVGDPKDYRVASFYTLKEYDAVRAALEALDAPLHKKETP